MKGYKKDILILLSFIFLDMILHYFAGYLLNLLLKPLFAFYMAYRFNQVAIKPLSRKSKLVLISLGIMLIGEILFVFRSYEMVKVILLLVFLIEHQLYISIFREENARLSDLQTRGKILFALSLILICFVFFGFLMMPNIPDNFLFLGIIYCVQLSVMCGLAVARQENKTSCILVLIALITLLASDAATSYSFFIGSFNLDYVVIRSLFLIAKIFFVAGILFSKGFNRSDKEYT